MLILGTIVEAAGGGITAFTGDTAALTIGLFLVGLGWCAANIASTAIVIDSTNAALRGRAIGMTDSIAAVAGVAFPLSVGPVLEAWGVGVPGAVAILLLVPPSVLFLATSHLPRLSPTGDAARHPDPPGSAP